MTIKEIIEKFVIQHGKPTLVVAHTSHRYALRNILGNMPGISVCLLPSVAWPHSKIYLENFITRSVQYISKEGQP
jgi:hypothetical protein